jgi:hypothetical protein
MAKRILKNVHQQTLFWREAPQMPDGYYSSGPNPNLRRLVEEDYQIYVGRSKKQVTKRKAKGQQLSLMEG